MSEFDYGWKQDESENIDIEYLTDQIGVMRYGNCIACGKSSSEDRNMRWVTFGKNRQSMTRIALCENCSKKLAEML